MSPEAGVLIIEDDQDVAEAYATMLRDTYDVTVVNSGEAAIERLDSSVDVVLLDRRLPDITGDEVLDRMDREQLGCRVVMVTAVDPDLDIVEMEFDEYLVKPVSNESITAAVEQMLERNSYDVELQEMVAVATKLATLEAKMKIDQLEQSERYNTLRRRYDELNQAVDEDSNDIYYDATRERIKTFLTDF
jgi:DNA-binding response OmpR family regulator